jgi:Major Facilitator Superfamily
MTYFWVRLGSALGGGARYFVSGLAGQHIGETFPIGTLIVNVTGSFVVGFFAALTGPDGRLLIATDARIDMALPSLTLVEADLHASQAKAAAPIAIFLAGFATAPLAVGPLADRFGRKPVMLVGLALFTLSAAGSALALTIDALLAFRLEPHSRANQMCAHAN